LIKEVPNFCCPYPPNIYKISSAFSYNFISALTTAMAREHTKEFAAYIGSKQSAEAQREIRRLEKELTTMRKRSAELDAIIKKLYEDRVLEHTVEQFQMLSSGYTEEQSNLEKSVAEKESTIETLKDSVSNTDRFIAKAKRYTDITELTPELLRLFIQKIWCMKRR